MNRILLACAVSFSFAVSAWAQSDVEIITEFNGLDIEVKALGVPGVEFESDVDVEGVRAVRVLNHSNEIASCQFHALPDETMMTATPAASIAPNEEAVMRVPGKYSSGGPWAVLICQPEGITSPAEHPIERLDPGR